MEETKESVQQVEQVSPSETSADEAEIANYHGLTLQTVLVYAALNFVGFISLATLVASGAYARNIATDLGGLSKQSWLAQIIAIMTAALGPPMSQASDFWGRKWIVVVTMVFGCFGSIIISRATSMNMAIAGQVISGVLFGSQPIWYAIISEILPRKFRAAAQGGFNASLGLGAIYSIIVGTVLIKKYDEGWRILYYISAGLLAVSAVITALLYNPPRRPLQASLSQKQKIKQVDWVGVFLLTDGIVFFSMALTWSKNPYSWTDAHILAPFVPSIILLIGLVVHQTWLKKDGMFHHELFRKDRNFALALLCIFIEGMGFFAANGFLIFEVAVLYDTDPLKAGLRYCVTFLTACVTSFAIGAYCSHTHAVRGATVIAFALIITFNALMATVTPSSSAAVWGYPAILGVGFGIALTTLVTAAQLSAPPGLIAMSSGLMISMRCMGGAVGFPIYNAIFNSKIASNIGPKIAAAVLPLGLNPQYLPAFIGALAGNHPEALMQIPGITPQMIGAGVKGLKEAYAVSFKGVWICTAAVSAVGLIAAAFMINPGKDFNLHVDAPLDSELDFGVVEPSRIESNKE